MEPCPYCDRDDSHRHTVTIERGVVAVTPSVLDVPCSVCGAVKLGVCRSTDGHMREPHTERRVAADAS